MPDDLDVDPEFAHLADGQVIEAALRKAVRQAVRRHKLLGNPICEWRDGRVVWIPPENIQIEPDPGDDARPSAEP
jgi:hypothetical protein